MRNPPSAGSSLGIIITVSDEDTNCLARVSKNTSDRAAQDEWGLFDPARHGLAAVLAGLDKAKRSR